MRSFLIRIKNKISNQRLAFLAAFVVSMTKAVSVGFLVSSFLVAILSCATKAPKFGNVEVLKKNEEFDKRVQIVLTEEVHTIHAETTSTTLALPKLPTPPQPSVMPPTTSPQSSKASSLDNKKNKSELKTKTKKDKKNAMHSGASLAVDSGSSATNTAALNTTTTTMPSLAKHEPAEVEGTKGFDGRRPIADPFRVGEKVIHSVRYFKVQAGSLMLEVRPFAFVNGKKSYNFRTSIKSSSFFSSFYSVDDYATTLVDYETLVPSVYTMHVKESGQLREARALFDPSTSKATFWDKKQTEKDGVQEKRVEWDMMAYSQNVYSAAYYMRVFNWDVGVENAFRIAHDGDNLIFKGKAIRREKISTKVGEFNALVVKLDFYLKGKFTPTGDIYFWLSDDDRKFILRIESEIKIGTLVSEIEELHKGY